jgi:hypothetical protein
MSSSESVQANDLRELHAATTVLRSVLSIELGDLLPPYAEEVLTDLQDMTADSKADPAKIRALVSEAASVMEMLPSVPAEWLPVARAAGVAGLSPEPG